MKRLPNMINIDLTGMLIPSFDHKEPEADDCGLPENSVSSNYSKYRWGDAVEHDRSK